jgi:hypothetical protein
MLHKHIELNCQQSQRRARQPAMFASIRTIEWDFCTVLSGVKEIRAGMK